MLGASTFDEIRMLLCTSCHTMYYFNVNYTETNHPRKCSEPILQPYLQGDIKQILTIRLLWCHVDIVKKEVGKGEYK